MIDWATISFPAEARDQIRELLGFADWDCLPGSRGYAERRCAMEGERVAVSMLVDGTYHQRGREVVTLHGAYFSSFGERVMADILSIEGARLTRVDLAYDDRLGDLQFPVICEAVKRGEVVGFRVCNQTHNIAGGRGNTLYFGRRGKLGNGRYVRIYDKAAEQGLPESEHWVRYELELSGDCARQFGEAWLIAGDREQWCAMCLVGGIDFRTVAADEHLDRRARVAWWARVVDFISGGASIRICRREPVRTVKEYADGRKVAVARSLTMCAVALSCLGGEQERAAFVKSLFSAGLSPRQWRRLRGWCESGELEFFAVMGGLSRYNKGAA